MLGNQFAQLEFPDMPERREVAPSWWHFSHQDALGEGHPVHLGTQKAAEDRAVARRLPGWMHEYEITGPMDDTLVPDPVANYVYPDSFRAEAVYRDEAEAAWNEWYGEGSPRAVDDPGLRESLSSFRRRVHEDPRGVLYENKAEDRFSTSAVVPNTGHLRRRSIERFVPPHEVRDYDDKTVYLDRSTPGIRSAGQNYQQLKLFGPTHEPTSWVDPAFDPWGNPIKGRLGVPISY